ncbi:MAG: hypothetical protein ABI624_17625, partial [Casimicrobiaceae bacterium]
MAYLSRCGLYWQNGYHAKALESMQIARALAEKSGVRVLDAVIGAQKVYIALSELDAASANDELARMDSM